MSGSANNVERLVGSLDLGRARSKVARSKVARSGRRRLIPMWFVAVGVVAGCSGSEVPVEAQDSVVELDSADEACQTVARANELMASADAAERASGEAVASVLWDRASQDDQLSDWLRRSCGIASLQMAYEAGLRVNGIVADE